MCVGKVAEVYDMVGRVTPIVAMMKLDLHVLVQRKLQWDDNIPDDLRPMWLSNFEMIQELKNLKFKRAMRANKSPVFQFMLDFFDKINNILASLYSGDRS